MQKIKSYTCLFSILIVWIMIFVMGMTINSGSYVTKLGEEQSLLFSVGSIFMVAFSWTWSNLVLLCILSALIGEIGRNAMNAKRTKINFQGAIIRGFFIYLMITAGQVIIAGGIPMPDTGEISTNLLVTDPQQYLRISSFSSLLAFLVGFTPSLFERLLKNLQQLNSADVVGVKR